MPGVRTDTGYGIVSDEPTNETGGALALVRALIAALDEAEVRYCHWKSNVRLARSLAGLTDLDLLVDPGSRDAFERVVTDSGFIVTQPDRGRDAPGARHYLALDVTSGRLVHLDVLGAIVTGGSLAKPYRLEVEQQIWPSIERLDGVPVPSKPVELALLMVRKAVEAASLPEHLLMRREAEAVAEEFEWLTAEAGTESAAIGLLGEWFPELPVDIATAIIPALTSGGWQDRQRTGRTVASALRGRRRLRGWRLALARMRELRRLLRRRIGPRRAGQVLAIPAPIIAFVGPKAVGKSTLIADTVEWLSPHVDVRAIHAGKPPPTVLSALPNTLLPLARRVFAGYRHSTVGTEERKTMPARRSPGSAAFIARSLLLARDKRAQLQRADRWRKHGIIVISDRYPLPGPDGPLLNPVYLEERGLLPEARAARKEHDLLASLPAPDIVAVLRASEETVVGRNEDRRGVKPDADDESAIRLHYEETSRPDPAISAVIELDTSGDLHATRLRLRAELWRVLLTRGARAPAAGGVSAPILGYDAVARGDAVNQPGADVLRE